MIPYNVILTEQIEKDKTYLKQITEIVSVPKLSIQYNVIQIKTEMILLA